MSENLIDAPSVATRLGVEVNTLYQWNYRGVGPRPIKLNGGRLRWRPSDVDAYIASCERGEPDEAA